MPQPPLHTPPAAQFDCCFPPEMQYLFASGDATWCESSIPLSLPTSFIACTMPHTLIAVLVSFSCTVWLLFIPLGGNNICIPWCHLMHEFYFVPRHCKPAPSLAHATHLDSCFSFLFCFANFLCKFWHSASRLILLGDKLVSGCQPSPTNCYQPAPFELFSNIFWWSHSKPPLQWIFLLFLAWTAKKMPPQLSMPWHDSKANAMHAITNDAQCHGTMQNPVPPQRKMLWMMWNSAEKCCGTICNAAQCHGIKKNMAAQCATL